MSDEKLIRGISRWDLTAIAINTVIGTGIFLLPAQAAALIGSFSLIALFLCSIIVAFIVLCFVEVASRFQTTGGMYLYAKESFGSVVGFEVGWLYWIVRITTFATNSNAFLIYLGFFVPAANEGWLRIILICSIVLIVTVVNFIGVRESTIVTNIFTIGKILPLLIFAAIGMFFIQSANFSFAVTPEYKPFSEAMLLLIYAYVGFEAAVIPAGETRDPQKNVPFALLTALIFCAVLFIIIQIVCIGTLPDVANSKRPLADAASNFLGSFGAAFITVGALISIFGNLNSGFLTASRMPFAMAEQKELPQIIGKTHEKFKTPYISLLITSIIILIVTLQSSFISALTISVITRLIVYATTCAALPVLRRRKDFAKAQVVVPFGIVAAILSLLLIIWLLTNVNFQKDGVNVLIVAAVGLIIYFAYNFGKRLNKEPSTD